MRYRTSIRFAYLPFLFQSCFGGNACFGLKLTSKHFFANQYSQTEALNREAGRSLTSYNYGLGEVLEGIGDNLEIEISGDTMSTLCVRLKSCNAITKGGLPIVYYDGLYGDEKPSATISESGLQAEDSEYMVLISVDPYHLIPVGEPDPEEVPLHHPYVLPSIKLHIVPKNQVNKSLRHLRLWNNQCDSEYQSKSEFRFQTSFFVFCFHTCYDLIAQPINDHDRFF